MCHQSDLHRNCHNNNVLIGLPKPGDGWLYSGRPWCVIMQAFCSDVNWSVSPWRTIHSVVGIGGVNTQELVHWISPVSTADSHYLKLGGSSSSCTEECLPYAISKINMTVICVSLVCNVISTSFHVTALPVNRFVIATWFYVLVASTNS